MSQYLLFFVLGVAVGSIYAGLTMGIVLTRSLVSCACAGACRASAIAAADKSFLNIGTSLWLNSPGMSPVDESVLDPEKRRRLR